MSLSRDPTLIGIRLLLITYSFIWVEVFFILADFESFYLLSGN